jgi:hypothetical protein
MNARHQIRNRELNAGVLELGRRLGTEADPTVVPEPVSERGPGSLRRHQW